MSQPGISAGTSCKYDEEMGALSRTTRAHCIIPSVMIRKRGPKERTSTLSCAEWTVLLRGLTGSHRATLLCMCCAYSILSPSGSFICSTELGTECTSKLSQNLLVKSWARFILQATWMEAAAEQPPHLDEKMAVTMAVSMQSPIL
eukprot:scaffold19225_cov18-Tisochrysis_lutea.AAC.1